MGSRRTAIVSTPTPSDTDVVPTRLTSRSHQPTRQCGEPQILVNKVRLLSPSWNGHVYSYSCKQSLTTVPGKITPETPHREIGIPARNLERSPTRRRKYPSGRRSGMGSQAGPLLSKLGFTALSHTTHVFLMYGTRRRSKVPQRTAALEFHRTEDTRVRISIFPSVWMNG
jgi:hypothetical protein